MISKICVFLVTLYSIKCTNGATAKRSIDDLPIKYPGPSSDVSNRYGTLDEVIPDECKDKNYCLVKPPDYPQEEFNKMFKGYKPMVQPTLILDPAETVDNRQGDPDERDDCESEVTYEPLFKVRNKRGDWRNVIQAPEENFVQKVRLETCSNPLGACFTILPQTPDIITFCKQKYNVWEFLVSDGKNGTEKMKTELPVCCSCHYKPADFASRFGKPKDLTTIKPDNITEN